MDGSKEYHIKVGFKLITCALILTIIAKILWETSNGRTKNKINGTEFSDGS